MDRAKLIAAEVEQVREAARRKADDEGPRLASEYSIRGLGRSGPLLKALLATDLAAVEAVLEARIEAEDRYALKGASAEQAVMMEAATNEVRSLVESEMAWLEERITADAERMGLLGVLGNAVQLERERLFMAYERDLRVRAGRRQRATESLPYFPDVGVEWYEKKMVHVLEAPDVATTEGIQHLCDLLYQHEERDVYLFIRQNEIEPQAFAAAKDRGAIVVVRTEGHFYKHPKFQLDYVKILPGQAKWDWERELQREGQDFRRLRLRFSAHERARRAAIEATQPPDYSEAMRALWVLESDLRSDDQVRQGTAFALSGVGVITCDHVLQPGTAALRAGGERRNAVKVLARNPEVDLAVLDVEGGTPVNFQASDEDVRVGDPVVLLGFPNYRHGDSGVVHHGRISGSRKVGQVRRLLLTADVVVGMSGGPVLDARGTVVAVAVTGADRMDQTRETEDQSAIPIDALRHLKKPEDRE
jgi:S1-C subfamily serine protease